MSAFILAAGLAVGASAAVFPRDHCCFPLTASGGQSGTVGQLSDGQNRIGGGYAPATYCLNNGAITDSQGRGCILTPPTTQFQCDTGATPTPGFSISGEGEVEYHGSPKFYACPASSGVYNIYTTPVSGQDKCVEITLSSGGKCMGSGSASSSMPAKSSPTAESIYQAPTTLPPYECQAPVYTTKTESVPAMSETMPAMSYSMPAMSESKPAMSYSMPAMSESTPAMSYSMPAMSESMPAESAPASYAPSATSGSACPTALTGAYQTPHLIVPISSSQPDKAYGTQYNATVSSDECTVFNFDIPYSYAGKSCSTVFLFPEQSELETSAYTFTGEGHLVFSKLSSAANEQTTWKNCPSTMSKMGEVAIKPGNSYAISTESCAVGTTQSIKMCSTNGMGLEFFEDYNPSPLGVFMTMC